MTSKQSISASDVSGGYYRFDPHILENALAALQNNGVIIYNKYGGCLHAVCNLFRNFTL
jgi:hypothetical protein